MTCFGQPTPLRLGLFVLAIGACELRADREPAGTPLGAWPSAGGDECAVGSVRPAAGAPAEGVWGFADPATSHRVAAMIGPPKSSDGVAQVTRRVETLESSPGADTIRHASDTASVRLEHLPPVARPAAVYPIGPLVLLASYESCGVGMREPLIRYLRQDGHGRVATDVLLRRDARP